MVREGQLHSVNPPHKTFTNYKGENCNFALEKNLTTHPHQVIKVIISKKTFQYHIPPDTVHWEGPTLLQWYSSQKHMTFNLILRKDYTNPYWEYSAK